MKKTTKTILCIAAVTAILVGSIGGYTLYKNANTRVEVFPVSLISTSSWGYSESSYGFVTTDMSQEVYLDTNAVIEEILVSEGDTVSVGTPLLQLDHTLSNLDLEMQALAIDNIDIKINAINRDIQFLETASPVKNMDDLNILNVSIQANDQLKLTSPGKGSANPDEIVARLDADTYLFLKEDTQNIYTVKCAPETIITPEFLQRILGFNPYTGRKQSDPLIVFLQIPEIDKRIYLDGYTFQIPDGFAEMTLSDFMQLPNIAISENASSNLTENNPYDGISSEERDTQLKAKKHELTTLTLDRKEAVLNYEKKRREVSSGTILSTVNGQVQSVGNVNDPIDSNTPFITVTSKEGFYLKGTINELDLKQISVGQTLFVTNMENGMSAEAKITAISEFPVSDNARSYGANPNTSNYPFTAYLSDAEGFKNNQYVNITMDSNEDSAQSGLYIPLSYIRDDHGESYVFIADENNRLKKQTVETGAILYGSYQEIKSGLTNDDLITFPYGKNIKDGVQTVETDSPSVY